MPGHRPSLVFTANTPFLAVSRAATAYTTCLPSSRHQKFHHVGESCAPRNRPECGSPGRTRTPAADRVPRRLPRRRARRVRPADRPADRRPRASALRQDCCPPPARPALPSDRPAAPLPFSGSAKRFTRSTRGGLPGSQIHDHHAVLWARASCLFSPCRSPPSPGMWRRPAFCYPPRRSAPRSVPAPPALPRPEWGGVGAGRSPAGLALLFAGDQVADHHLAIAFLREQSVNQELPVIGKPLRRRLLASRRNRCG